LIRQKRILRANNRDNNTLSPIRTRYMANQFQNRLVTAIREIVAQGKPAKVGGLGVFCMVHREPTERTRDDGAVVLTPPANIIEFMPDPFLKSSKADPVMEKLLEDLLYDVDLLKDAIENFSTDIYNSSKDCSVLVHGLGTFRNLNGKLGFKPSEDLSKEVNAVYEGLKEIEINSTPKFKFNKPRSLSNGPDEDELISVVTPITENDNAANIYKLSLWKSDQTSEDSISVIPDSTTKNSSNKGFELLKADPFFDGSKINTYNFGDRIGFDDGLAEFGTKRKAQKLKQDFKPTELDDLTSRLDALETSISKVKPIEQPSEGKTEFIGLNSEISESVTARYKQDEAEDFEPTIFDEFTSRIEEVEIVDSEELKIVDEIKIQSSSPKLDSFTNEDETFEAVTSNQIIEKSPEIQLDKDEQQEFASAVFEQPWVEEKTVYAPTLDDSKFFENPASSLKNPHDLFEEELTAGAFKVNFFGKNKALEQKRLEEEEKKRKEEQRKLEEEAERQRLIEEERKKAEDAERLEQERLRLEEEARIAEEQRLLEEEQRALEAASRSKYQIPEEETQAFSGQFNFKRTGKKNINRDYSHLQDSVISPVLPNSNKGAGDKGLGVAISVAAMILFAIMLFLVYSLFPHQEPDFFRANLGTANLENRAAIGLDNRSAAAAGMTNPLDQSTTQPNTDPVLNADEVLLELTRQHRGGLFGLNGDFNPNIAPFYGIVIYSSPLRSEADDLAERLRAREWRTSVIPHQRTDGSRVWRVMIGQFSTVTDANLEARLLPAELRREFIIQRVD